MRVGVLIGRCALVLAAGLSTAACGVTIPAGSDKGQTPSGSTDFSTDVSRQTDFTTEFGTDASPDPESDYTSGFDSLDQSELSELQSSSS